ncbi:hypothetical protein [Sphingomonas sp. LHG3406-1]|nr:hypothetical protein [Sphingomonas sp. LHG3406-1]
MGGDQDFDARAAPYRHSAAVITGAMTYGCYPGGGTNLRPVAIRAADGQP